jgi:hypothetical protein
VPNGLCFTRIKSKVADHEHFGFLADGNDVTSLYLDERVSAWCRAHQRQAASHGDVGLPDGGAEVEHVAGVHDPSRLPAGTHSSERRGVTWVSVSPSSCRRHGAIQVWSWRSSPSGPGTAQRPLPRRAPLGDQQQRLGRGFLGVQAAGLRHPSRQPAGLPLLRPLLPSSWPPRWPLHEPVCPQHLVPWLRK